MSAVCQQNHFQFFIKASPELHQWLDTLDPIIYRELSITLEDLRWTDWQEHEHILVYLHSMYMFRFALPVLEAICGRERLLNTPQLAQFQLLSCLMGRFLDDLIDRDSGFWNQEQALFWYSRFLLRCEKVKGNLLLGQAFEDMWAKSLIANAQRLYRIDADSGRIHKPDSCPMPLLRYPERVPYFFCLPEALCDRPETLDWSRSYISALFFLYDVDDSFNDIMRNVATEPAYNLLASGLDSEGRFKMKLAKQNVFYQAHISQARELLISCRDNGRLLGLELGPAMIDTELEANGIAG